MSELAFARDLTKKLLGNPSLDPDGDLLTLARAFYRVDEMRSVEIAEAVAAEREACAKIAEYEAATRDWQKSDIDAAIVDHVGSVAREIRARSDKARIWPT